MKKSLCLLLLLGSAVFCFAQTTGTLGIAITGAKSYVENQLPQGTRVLVADVAAPTRELAAYIADELSARLVNGKRLTLIERSVAVMQSLLAETKYQLSGEVSDESIQAIGNKTGAEVILTGSISGAGDQYRISVKLTGVKTSEVQGQWNTTIQTDTVLNSLLSNSRPAANLPQWANEPLTVRSKYEPNYSAASAAAADWYYDTGISNKAASEQLARTRARQNVQAIVAENIASEMKARIDITALATGFSSSVEDAEYRIEAALTNSIKTKVPRYETLEWYVETGKLDGKDWYIARVLVRFPRKDIITMVETVDPAKVADTVIKQLPGQTLAPDAQEELIRQMEAAKEYAVEGIREVLTEH
ncbi:MAG: penicillin-binding protein activator LpoB [Treponema sp.]|nr:penicillin-binding protein activator LpoB [Treponema sp.]